MKRPAAGGFPRRGTLEGFDIASLLGRGSETQPECPVRPGSADRLELEECDDSMKFRLSPSGCESRPARGEPAQPLASLATVSVTGLAKRR